MKEDSFPGLLGERICWHMFLLWEELERWYEKREGFPSTELPKPAGGNFLTLVPTDF